MRTAASKEWTSGSGVEGVGDEVSDLMVIKVSWSLSGTSMRVAEENSSVVEASS
jgi:hypothetical protein